MKSKHYDHKKIEKKWQREWDKSNIYKAQNISKKKKFYGLIEFPYPSGSGLHVGHIRSNTAMDIITRKRRMEGYNVLYPIGWDAFGLPTENYAIKTGVNPVKVTKTNTDIFRKQLKAGGFGFDWSREIDTTNEAYYKWTQWIFLQMYKKGLAYKKKTEINWCTKCKIGLANEEVVGGVCERCGGEVVKKEKEQWMLAITKYADRLDKDLDKVDYLEKIKMGQRNWIGESEGSEIKFKIFANTSFFSGPRTRRGAEAGPDQLEKGNISSNLEKPLGDVSVFTTRADTLFGATYVVLAPEHELIEKLKSEISNWEEVRGYINKIKNKTDIERTGDDKEKTGVELKGIKAINPANNEEIPVWIADYVLVQYGTGAVMAVPAHDERDWDFAKKYNLPIKDVIKGDSTKEKASTEDGVLINSLEFNGLSSQEAREKITHFVGGKIVTKYKLRDWVFSRQRYWGEPIPIIHCDKCGYVPVKEKDLPITLPKVKSYVPTDNGESPLANIKSWVNTTCPKCMGKAKRETDTMPNWAGSSWYFLRYCDPKNKKEFASKKVLKYWMKNGVDWYNGGMEHTTLHLLYSRFWHKFLYDLKLVPTSEPYMKRTSHGMILAEGGEKMSKSRGNVINPDDIIRLYGADTLRLYEMFIGPFDQAVSWNTDSIIGSRRFLDKVWRLGQRVVSSDIFVGSSRSDLRLSRGTISSRQSDQALQTLIHKTIKKITEDIESMSFNTAISSMMILVNEMEKNDLCKKDFKMFLQILAPFAPHITEELWEDMGENKSIHISNWPKYNNKLIVDEKMKIIIQVNGKVRAEIMVDKNATEDQVKSQALEYQSINVWVNNKEIKRIIYVPGRILNIVV